MADNYSIESREPDDAGHSAIDAPAAPLSIRVSSGSRWAAISWQAPVVGADTPVDDYLLAIFPGNTTFSFGSATTGAVLLSLAPNRPYTFFVAARNAAGTSDWMPSSPVQLAYDAPPSPPLPPELLLFEELLALDDAALGPLLAAQDDRDLVLALSRTSEEKRAHILGVVLEPERAQRLDRRLTPQAEVDGRALARRAAQMRVVPPRPETEPAPPPPEIVIEVPPRRRNGNLLWLAVLAPVLLLLFFLASNLPAFLPQQANAELESTVEALVALQMATESAATPITTPESLPESAPVVATPLPQDAASDATVVAVYAEPAVELLNVRSGPGESYEIVETVSSGQRLQVMQRSDDGDWFFVATNSSEGWAASRFLAMEGNPRSPAQPATSAQAQLLPTAIPTLPPFLSPTPSLPPASSSEEPAAAPSAVVVEPQPVASPAEASVELQPDETELPAQPAAVDAAELTAHPCMVPGYFWLIYPVETTVSNQVTFRWGFSGVVPDECGFEIRLWRAGQLASGVHDAVADHHNGVVKLTRANEYRLDIPQLSNLPGVSGNSGDYYWTVSLVQVTPTYRDFGRQADPSYFYVQLH
jgi:hypothetical protein